MLTCAVLRAHGMLAGGLCLAILAAALVRFVLVGLIGLALAGCAAVLLLAHAARLGTASSGSRWWCLHLAGLLLLSWACIESGGVAFSLHLHAQRPALPLPTALDWSRVVGAHFLAAAVLASSLTPRRHGCTRQFAAWLVTLLAISPAIFALTALFARFLPLSA